MEVEQTTPWRKGNAHQLNKRKRKQVDESEFMMRVKRGLNINVKWNRHCPLTKLLMTFHLSRLQSDSDFF